VVQLREEANFPVTIYCPYDPLKNLKRVKFLKKKTHTHGRLKSRIRNITKQKTIKHPKLKQKVKQAKRKIRFIVVVVFVALSFALHSLSLRDRLLLLLISLFSRRLVSSHTRDLRGEQINKYFADCL
jgi:hypothetical protein